MSNECSIPEIRFKERSLFLIWFEDDRGNGCVYTLNNKVQTFKTENTARECAEALKLNCAGTFLYDAEKLISLIAAHEKAADCEFLLDFWNLFGDIAYSVGRKFEPVNKTLRPRLQ